jgi:hypothetical protein
MSRIVNQILQALQNLGGQATSNAVIEEIENIRATPLTLKERKNLRVYLHIYSSKGRSNRETAFQKIRPGLWALNNHGQASSTRFKPAQDQTEKAVFIPVTVDDEVVINALKTIKEYRDYYEPNSTSWFTYILEIFHILGFSTQQKDARLISIHEMGESQTPKALIAYSFPYEDFQEIYPGLSWESYLLFAANYHQVEWGILTNGLAIRMINYRTQKNTLSSFEGNLDEIIARENLESFYRFYLALLRIKNVEKGLSVTLKATKIDRAPFRYPKALSHILDVCREMAINNRDFRQACLSVTKRKKLLSIHTVPDACTRTIGLNTSGFVELCANKDNLIKHLGSYYPKHIEQIIQVLTEIA